MKIDTSLEFSGIYCIYNVVSGRRYIGSSTNIYRRLWKHFRALELGTHANQPMQNTWNLHGSDIFEYMVIEQVDDITKLAEIEKFYIDVLACCDCRFGYNIMSQTTGQALVNERAQKISNKVKGQKKTEDHKAKIGQATKLRYGIDENKVIELYKNGTPAEDIYRICNISKPTLRKIRKKYGILEPRPIVHKHKIGRPAKPKATCIGCGKELSKRKYTTCNQCRDKFFDRKPMSEETKQKISETKSGKQWDETLNQFV